MINQICNYDKAKLSYPYSEQKDKNVTTFSAS